MLFIQHWFTLVIFCFKWLLRKLLIRQWLSFLKSKKLGVLSMPFMPFFCLDSLHKTEGWLKEQFVLSYSDCIQQHAIEHWLSLQMIYAVYADCLSGFVSHKKGWTLSHLSVCISSFLIRSQENVSHINNNSNHIFWLA